MVLFLENKPQVIDEQIFRPVSAGFLQPFANFPQTVAQVGACMIVAYIGPKKTGEFFSPVDKPSMDG
jgi:hypothetical protein